MSAVTDAIAALQAAQKTLVDATKSIETHNIDLEAHADIRELIQKLMDSDVVYTKTEIRALIDAGLKTHLDTVFDKAHPGWDVYNKNTQSTLEDLAGKLETLEGRLDTLTGTAGMTDLQKQLQAVEDRYAPILAGLQASFSQAEKNGQTTLAEEYKNSISRTLDEKKNELLAVMTTWQEAHS